MFCPLEGTRMWSTPTDKTSISQALPIRAPRGHRRSEERRVGKECRSRCDWSSDVFSSDLEIDVLSVGGNPHVVYSNGQNIYLTSSSDQGATWTQEVRVNNGPGAKLGICPWIDAGDAGKVNIMWWSTNSGNSLASDAQWTVFFAQTQNAFAKNPTITENAATNVFHTGPICVHGTGCGAGTRNLAEYGSTTTYLDGKAMIVYADDQ